MSDDRTAGGLAAGVALGYVVIGVTYFALRANQLGHAAGLFASLAHDSTAVFRIHYWAFAATSLLAIGLVIGLRPEADRQPSLLVRMTRAWALLGFSVSALEFLYVQQRALAIASKWDALDPSARAALAALGIGRLDATWVLGFGIIGAWPIALGLAARRSGAWPKTVCWFGYGVGLAGGLVCLGSLTGVFAFVNIARRPRVQSIVVRLTGRTAFQTSGNASPRLSSPGVMRVTPERTRRRWECRTDPPASARRSRSGRRRAVNASRNTEF
jgi:hypothetical protein